VRRTDRARARSSACTAAMRFEGLSSWPSSNFLRNHNTHMPLEQHSRRHHRIPLAAINGMISRIVTIARFRKTPSVS
jgi:hypothetical protein